MLRIVQEALTFDDVLLVPARSAVVPRDVELRTSLTREIGLSMPLVSAAMDTVTEARMAIAMAQEGGLGIVHKNMALEQQAAKIRTVKKFESGVINDPITVSPDTSIRELRSLTQAHGISGVPVVDGRELVGIITNRDVRFETQLDQPVRNLMTPQERLVTVREGAPADEVLGLMHRHRIEKILVINGEFELHGMITVKDIQKASDFPLASKDERGQLRVGAALGTGADTDERSTALADAGVDVLVVDTAHGHSQGVLDRVKWLKHQFPEIQVVAGNVATGDAAKDLVAQGADAVKVGIGPGSICTTRMISGVGMPQISAIANVADALKGTGVPLIADGGIRYSGDIAKAIAAGAYTVMAGGLFAGTDEAPGEVELYQGRSYKIYRGMGSLGAMSNQHGSGDRYFQDSTDVEKLVPEGIEGRVPYKGSVLGVIHQLLGGVRSSMGYVGAASMEEMRTLPRFVRITGAGVRESHVHDVSITKEAPNYRIDS